METGAAEEEGGEERHLENPSRRARELGWVTGGMEEAEEGEEARWDGAPLLASPAVVFKPSRPRQPPRQGPPRRGCVRRGVVNAVLLRGWIF